jgi:hypothetical protein
LVAESLGGQFHDGVAELRVVQRGVALVVGHVLGRAGDVIGGDSVRAEERLDRRKDEAVRSCSYEVDLVAVGLFAGGRLLGDGELERFGDNELLGLQSESHERLKGFHRATVLPTQIAIPSLVCPPATEKAT